MEVTPANTLEYRISYHALWALPQGILEYVVIRGRVIAPAVIQDVGITAAAVRDIPDCLGVLVGLREGLRHIVGVEARAQLSMEFLVFS